MAAGVGHVAARASPQVPGLQAAHQHAAFRCGAPEIARCIVSSIMQSLPAGDHLQCWRHRRLSVLCGACGWAAAPLVSVLAAQLGPGATLGEAAARLACRDCGGPLTARGLVAAPPAAAPPEAERRPGVPLFALTPTATAKDSLLWAGSTHHGPCRVAAPHERRARFYAANAFADPKAPRSASGLLPASPWTLPAVVAAGRAASPGGDHLPEGTVMVPDDPADPRGAFRVLVLGEA